MAHRDTSHTSPRQAAVMHRLRRVGIIVFFVLPFMFVLVMLAREVWSRYEYWQIDITGISTQATVIRAVTCGRPGTKIGVRFTTQYGIVIETQPDLCFNETYVVGQRITIWYRPADLARVVPAADYRGSSSGDFFAGLCCNLGFLIAGVVAVRSYWRQLYMPQRVTTS